MKMFADAMLSFTYGLSAMLTVRLYLYFFGCTWKANCKPA